MLPVRNMTGSDLKTARERKGWTQEQTAFRLGISQPYLSLLEKNFRRVPDKLARKAMTALRLSAVTLPVQTDWKAVKTKSEGVLAADLAALGYPGFSHVKGGRRRNPAEVLLSALSARDLNSRVTEALPWVLLEYSDLDWESLTKEAKVRDLQNRLGFLISVARKVAENHGDSEKAELLLSKETMLERSRLLLEDTLCNDSLTRAEREWLKTSRSQDAKFWNILTDLTPEHLSYASTS